MYTLITSLGTGGNTDGKGYRTTKYVFPDKKECETNIFLKAILKTGYKEISKIILVGTKTSGWDMLAEDNEELWNKVYEAREKNSITEELLNELQDYLSQEIKIPVIIKCHTDKIDSDTSLEIFNIYNSIIPEINDENILFDITHGFRSMPILLYQALQFSVSQNSKIKNVELVYGEYNDNDKKSYVRNLSNYWKYSQITDALALFDEKLDGTRLADLIEKDWAAGSKAIKRFTEIVQTNFCLQFIKVSRQIKNAISKYPKNAPEYLDKIKKIFEDLCKLIDKNYQSRTLYNLSKYFYEHKLNVQAVICLQVAVEVCECEHQQCQDYIGNYEWWQDYGKSGLQITKKNNFKEIGSPLSNLEGFRNKIAHGGGPNKDGNFPQAANIPSIYEKGKRGLENLFKEYGF